MTGVGRGVGMEVQQLETVSKRASTAVVPNLWLKPPGAFEKRAAQLPGQDGGVSILKMLGWQLAVDMSPWWPFCGATG